MAIIVGGVQGSGKGTQAELLVQTLGRGWTHISTGDLVDQIGSEDQRERKRTGKLVANEEIEALLVQAWDAAPDKSKIVFDGFPRNPAQVERIVQMMQERHVVLTHVLILDLPDDEMAVNRVLHRHQTSERQRADDADGNAIRERIATFRTVTEPALRSVGQVALRAGMPGVEVINIDATPGIPEVHNAIMDELGMKYLRSDRVENAD